MLESSWVAAQLAASQQELMSMELADNYATSIIHHSLIIFCSNRFLWISGNPFVGCHMTCMVEEDVLTVLCRKPLYLNLNWTDHLFLALRSSHSPSATPERIQCHWIRDWLLTEISLYISICNLFQRNMLAGKGNDSWRHATDNIHSLSHFSRHMGAKSQFSLREITFVMWLKMEEIVFMTIMRNRLSRNCCSSMTVQCQRWFQNLIL
jgi:hypothetical protein